MSGCCTPSPGSPGTIVERTPKSATLHGNWFYEGPTCPCHQDGCEVALDANDKNDGWSGSHQNGSPNFDVTIRCDGSGYVAKVGDISGDAGTCGGYEASIPGTCDSVDDYLSWVPQPHDCCVPPFGSTPAFYLHIVSAVPETPPYVAPCNDCPPGSGSDDNGNAAPPSGSDCPATSQNPIRYATGEVMVSASDISSGGYGLPWGHSRSFASRLAVNRNIGQGYNWQVAQWPYLLPTEHGLAVMGKSTGVAWASTSGTTATPRFGAKSSFAVNTSAGQTTQSRPDGGSTVYSQETGRFLKRTTSGGHTLEVITDDGDGVRIMTVRQSAVVDGVTTTDEFSYTYTGPGNFCLANVTLRRQIGGGSWINIERANYTYYGQGESFGGIWDLQTVQQQVWQDGAWATTGMTVYRYYLTDPGTSSSSSSTTANSSSSSGGGSDQEHYPHLLKYVLNPAAYNRMVADGYDPLTASNTAFGLYADNYFEYDADRRVTKELVDGGSRTFLFSYAESGFADTLDAWKSKTTEMLPDGTQNIVYCNYAGQTLLFVHKSGTDQWIRFYQYNSDFRLMLQASPSAVTGYDDTVADLLNYDSGTGKYQYLRDSAGLIQTWTYHAPSGYVASESVQEGQTGTSIKLVENTYTCCGGSGSSSSSSSSSSGSSSSGGCEGGSVWLLSQQTVYPSDTNQSLTQVTSYAYTYYSGTCAVQQKTTTLPVVPTDQNGSGVAVTRKDYFDPYGNLTWSMDERGFITRRAYDIPTGAMTQQVSDADTSLYSDAPAGWTTPSGGGLNVVTDITVNSQGRMTESLGPTHSIDLAGTATTVRRATWLVYDDANHITYAGQGFLVPATSTYTLINPVSITKMDAGGKVLEQIQATAASTSGTLASIISTAGGGAAAFPQTSYTGWTTNQYTDCCLAASTRVYHTIPASGEGASGTNYDETDFGYDVMKRRNRTVTPGGTITYQVFDARGLVSSTWIGTNDNGATDQDPSGGGASGNNMVLVTGNVYDGGTDGGDGNLTQQTQYASASDTRVTTFTYDFRDRRVTTDGEVDDFQKQYYDNLDRVVKSERYDTTVSGNLIARSETKFDPRGQVYQTIRYGVDPSTGTVGNALTDNTLYDAAGNAIKSLPAGSDLFSKAVYDSLGRTTTRYVGYDTAETSYSDAGSVTDDVILEQNETSYDAARNVLQTTTRQRYHNAPASQLGALGNPSTTPKARVTYAAQWADSLGRTVAAANYGTNGGSALSRPSTIPSRSDTVLVTSVVYDETGKVQSVTDPAGKVTRTEYDDAGRKVTVIENYQGSSSSSSSSSSSGGCSPSDDENRTTSFTYTPDGAQATLTAQNSRTANQTTTYAYGTTLSNSEVATSTLLRTITYPDSSGGSDVVTFSYNRQGQRTTATDQRGCVHSYDYDKLGRLLYDRVTTLGTGVDGAVRRLGATYEVRGMPVNLTSYDNATVGSGAIVNQVQQAYNSFAQLVSSAQEHGGAVSGSSPTVGLSYANGSANTVRPTGMDYPSGRSLTYDYGTSGGISDHASRIASLIDDDGTAHLADYSFLGLGAIVVVDFTEPDVEYTLVDLSGSNDPDTGDIYSGLDRFGRVKDCRWYDYGSPADVARLQYGYDRASNRLWRADTVAQAAGKDFDELYSYDGLHRLQTMERGLLNGGHTAIGSQTYGQCWNLDATGNWTGMKEADGGSTWTLQQSRTANPVNEITGITNTVGSAWAQPAYDPAGNMTTIPQPADPTQDYTATYDAWNRLVKLVDGSNTVQENAYDARTFRTVRKDYTGGTLSETRHFYYDPAWRCVEERVGSSTSPNRQYVWGLRYIDDLVLRDRDTGGGTLNERLYGLQDANWNMVALVDTAGAVQERSAYAPYGEVGFLSAAWAVLTDSAVDNGYTFTGRELDTMTGLFCFRYRWLASHIGGFVSRDPTEYDSGLSMYRLYNSMTSTDPLGLRDFPGLPPTFGQRPGEGCAACHPTQPRPRPRPPVDTTQFFLDTSVTNNDAIDACGCQHWDLACTQEGDVRQGLFGGLPEPKPGAPSQGRKPGRGSIIVDRSTDPSRTLKHGCGAGVSCDKATGQQIADCARKRPHPTRSDGKPWAKGDAFVNCQTDIADTAAECCLSVPNSPWAIPAPRDWYIWYWSQPPANWELPMTTW